MTIAIFKEMDSTQSRLIVQDLADYLPARICALLVKERIYSGIVHQYQLHTLWVLAQSPGGLFLSDELILPTTF